MKKARNVKVGAVIQFPHYCFDERRSGWNGWIFRAGIVENFGTTKSGVQYASVRYCSKRAGRTQLLPCEESTKNIKTEYLFEYNVESHIKYIRYLLECESHGEAVCWDDDAALLLKNGLV